MLVWMLIIIGALLILVGWFWQFFSRKPKRSIPEGKNIIISPADGTIAKIQKFWGPVTAKKWNRGQALLETKDVAKEGWFVLIMMTPLNVHWQRAPLEGKVIHTAYSPGKFLNAVSDAASLATLENERNEILYKTKFGNIKVVQLAGLLARRIYCFVKKQDTNKKGDVIGFISFGSQVALLLPKNAKLEITEGMKVHDGMRIGEFT